MKKIKKALISVSDKKNLGSLLKILAKYKIELISSGGTYKEIKKLKFKCQEVSEYTGSPEILGGRVKTLHPKIHAGILSKRNDKSHTKELKANQYDEIDLVIVNFYPFEKTLEQTTNHSKIIENIDAVSYTHLRAHETVLDLVCRLLLEKKKHNNYNINYITQLQHDNQT